ncbi:hypothetical protein [Streptomyces sp. NPDC048489]|uniref:hypothetical protein n=1 Tax=Streptomyces sp. NPDC048489 TaxID=3154504 RepID=UPI00344483F0
MTYKVRETTEAIVGAITGSRGDTVGTLAYIGRTTTLAAAAAATVGPLLSRPAGEHPWRGWSFSAGWGSRDTLDATLVKPDLVGEVGVDIARDSAGRWRHPVRWHRPRPDLSPTDVANHAAH